MTEAIAGAAYMEVVKALLELGTVGLVIVLWWFGSKQTERTHDKDREVIQGIVLKNQQDTQAMMQQYQKDTHALMAQQRDSIQHLTEQHREMVQSIMQQTQALVTQYREDTLSTLKQYREDTEAHWRMYENNVELVKNYEKTSGDLKDVIVLVTQNLTELSETIKRRECS